MPRLEEVVLAVMLHQRYSDAGVTTTTTTTAAVVGPGVVGSIKGQLRPSREPVVVAPAC